jgi:protease-4
MFEPTPKRLTLLAVMLIASATIVSPALAGGTGSEIPSYYRDLDFNLTSPTAWTTAAGGYANPSVYAAMPGAELEWYGGVLDDGRDGLDRWGLFFGLKHLGIGAVHQRVPIDGGDLGVTDYRLALSFGDQASSLGVSLGWSRGDTDQLGRTTIMQVGTTERFGRYLSVGAVGTFSTERADQSGLADVAIRPLGDERLTVFGDLELPRGVKLEDAPWSAGAMLQFIPGASLVGRYFEDESFTLAFVYAFGSDREDAHVRGSVSPRFDKDGDHVATNYSGRIGFAERSLTTEYMYEDSHYLDMHLRGNIVHTRYKYFDPNQTLYDVLDQLEHVRTDRRVSGVAINLSGARISRGNAWELREKLEQVQDAGKGVVVYIDEAGMNQYHVASAADRIVMEPEGLLILPGYTMGRTFIRNMLEKVGLGAEEWRFRDYKSAMEFLVRHEMSEADREQRQALVDEYYRTMTGDVAESREVSQETVDGWVDEITLVTPQRALEEGIVDELGLWEDVDEVIEELEGEKKRRRGARPSHERRAPTRRWGVMPQIAVVYAIGECALDSGIRARRLSKLIRRLSGRRDVKAVVLRVNSPGGSPLASDIVAEAVKECVENKPVIVSQGDVAASGGYYISMCADEIVVQPTTITGSIGVIGGWVWDDGMGEKLGMEGDMVKAGEHADIFFSLRFPFVGIKVPHRPLTDTERERVLEEMGIFYERFVDSVAEARGLDRDEVAEIAKGRVWTGVQGIDNGLADTIGGLETAIARAREKAGYDPDDEIAVVQYGSKGLFDANRFEPMPFLPFLNRSDTETDSGLSGLDFLDEYEFTYLRELARHNGRPLCMIPPEFMPRESGHSTD